jgi:hypothetical protein
MNLGVGVPSFRFLKRGAFAFVRSLSVFPSGSVFNLSCMGREAEIATHPNGAGRNGARGKMYPPKKVLTS